MHEKIADVVYSGRHIRLRCKPNQAVFEKKDTERIDAHQ